MKKQMNTKTLHAINLLLIHTKTMILLPPYNKAEFCYTLQLHH